MAGERKIRAVIFDMDGVLTDSEPLISAAAAAMFREQGLTVRPEDFRPFVGTGEDRYIGGVAEKYNFPIDLAAAKKRTYEIYLEQVPSQLTAFPGAVELVRACQNAGLKIAVASSADRIKLDANLRKIGLEPGSWDATVTAEDVARKKPAPDIFLAAAQKLGLTPEQCVVVEDAVNGVRAANAAGMRCVAVAQTFPPEQLQNADVARERISEVTVADLAGEPESVGISVPPRAPIGASPEFGRRAPAEPRPWGFWATLGFSFGIAVGAQAVAGVVLVVVAGVSVRGLESSGLYWALATMSSAPVVVGLSWLCAWIRRELPVKEYLGLKAVPARKLLPWCLALLILLPLTDWLTTMLNRPVVPDIMIKVFKTARSPLLLWLALVVAAPLSEEIFFRGFLFKGILHSPPGGVGAIILTSLAWSAVHLQYDVYGVAIIFVTGLLFGYARWKTDSIVPGIIMHALMNALATLQVMAMA